MEVYFDAKNMNKLLQSDIATVRTLRLFSMKKKPEHPFQMLAGRSLDYQKGIKVKSRRVYSFYMKDPSLEKIAALGLEDNDH